MGFGECCTIWTRIHDIMRRVGNLLGISTLFYIFKKGDEKCDTVFLCYIRYKKSMVIDYEIEK